MNKTAETTFVYKLKLNDYNLKKGLENFTTSKLFTPDEKLKLEQELKKDKKVLSTYARFNL